MLFEILCRGFKNRGDWIFSGFLKVFYPQLLQLNKPIQFPKKESLKIVQLTPLWCKHLPIVGAFFYLITFWVISRMKMYIFKWSRFLSDDCRKLLSVNPSGSRIKKAFDRSKWNLYFRLKILHFYLIIIYLIKVIKTICYGRFK